MNQGSLFFTEGDAAPPKSCLFVTNHLNLLYMLASGLIMPPQGFGNKYYRDTLEACSGWVPLFRDTVSPAAVDHSVSEEEHLRPCIAEVRMDRLRGTVWSVREGDPREVDFPQNARASDELYLVPAPLPVHWITRVIFPSRSQLAAFRRDLESFSDVPRPVPNAHCLKKPFKAAKSQSVNSWPPTWKVPPRSAGLAEAQAAGGALAMLLQVANRGDQVASACGLAFDPDSSDPEGVEAHILRPSADWLRTARAPRPSDAKGLSGRAEAEVVQTAVFWEAVGGLARRRYAPGAETAEDLLIACLGKSASDHPGRLGSKLRGLARSMEEFAQFGDTTIDGLLERYTTPFARAMAVCFRYETCAELLQADQPQLQEADWAAAAILCGAREGWEDLPRGLREVPPALGEAVSHRMAALAHRVDGTGIHLGEPPARPLALRELFTRKARWGVREKRAALQLARSEKWDCIETVVRLGPGAYTVEIDRGGLRLLLKGEPAAVETAVRREDFLQKLVGARPGAKLEGDLRKQLGA